jgi:hypothetical protein
VGSSVYRIHTPVMFTARPLCTDLVLRERVWCRIIPPSKGLNQPAGCLALRPWYVCMPEACYTVAVKAQSAVSNILLLCIARTVCSYVCLSYRWLAKERALHPPDVD